MTIRFSTISIFMALVTVLSVQAQVATPRKPGPHITAVGCENINGTVVFRWGTLEPKVQQTQMKIMNDGTDTLRILGVMSQDATLGAYQTGKSVLAPGDTAAIGLYLQGEKAIGVTDRRISIYSNDTTQSMYHIMVRFVVKPDYFMVLGTAGKPVLSGAIILDTVKPNIDVPCKVRFVNSGDTELVLSVPKLDGGNVGMKTAIKDPIKLAPGKEADLSMTITPLPQKRGSDDAGRLYGTIVVKTSSRRMPEGRIVIWGTLQQVPDYVMTTGATTMRSPKGAIQFSLDSVKPNAKVPCNVHIVNNTDTILVFSVPKLDEGNITMSTPMKKELKLAAGKSGDIKMSIVSQLPKQGSTDGDHLHGTISIKTTSPTLPEGKIEVSGTLKR